jgi:glucokinase
MKKNKILAIDIGGSHITAGFVNLENRQLDPGSVVRTEVDSSGTVEAILNQWNDGVKDLLEDQGFSGKIGIAFPGPFDYEDGISRIKDQGKYSALYGLGLKELLAKSFGVKEDLVKFSNDAASFLQGEVVAGVAKGYSRSVGLTLGTGLGAAAYRGDFAEDAAQWEKPFKDSIAENYFSTKWFIKKYAVISGKTLAGVRELADMVPDDLQAKEIFEEFGQNLGQFLAGFVAGEKAELVVLGGNISKSFALFFPAMSRQMEALGCKVPVKLSQQGESATLIGAASIWREIGTENYSINKK